MAETQTQSIDYSNTNWLLISYLSVSRGPIKIKSFLPNIAWKSIFLILESNFFYSVMVNGKREFWKNVVL